MTTVEHAEVLAPDGIEASLVYGCDIGEVEILGDQHVPAAKGEEHGVFTRVIWEFVCRDETKRRYVEFTHASSLQELNGCHPAR